MVNKITSPITPLEEVAKINEIIDGKQDTLVSGTNIKTVGGNSLLGSGNIAVGTVTSVNNVSPVNGNVSLSIPTVNNATLTITQGGTTKGTFTANASSNVTIDLDSGGGASRNIGEIIQSTIPLNDAGLHLLDGSVISGSGSYSAFVTHIAELVSGHQELFTTEANWQQSVTDYGVCGKFVYDSINNTVRLPKYSDKFWSGLGTAGVKGNGMTLGLTSGSTEYGLALNRRQSGTDYGMATATAASQGQPVGSSYTFGSSAVTGGLTTNVTKSGIVADLSTITTALEGYWYIVIATSTKTQIEVDIDEIVTDLNGKADVDLSNCTKPHIVETYVNGTSWYRLYSDGWCEQGGIIGTVSANTVVTVTFPKPFATTSYTALVNHGLTSGSGNVVYQAIGFYNLTTTTATTLVQATNTQSGVPNTTWYACGMSAQS